MPERRTTRASHGGALAVRRRRTELTVRGRSSGVVEAEMEAVVKDSTLPVVVEGALVAGALIAKSLPVVTVT